jgi:hypothetical protein
MNKQQYTLCFKDKRTGEVVKLFTVSSATLAGRLLSLIGQRSKSNGKFFVLQTEREK